MSVLWTQVQPLLGLLPLFVAAHLLMLHRRKWHARRHVGLHGKRTSVSDAAHFPASQASAPTVSPATGQS